ncbi:MULTISPECIES: 3-hydroxyacyl-ACP dehydratase FabZ [unclassified Candidatus Frackibacter]|uniref:3-hydroxyacyl-ACP dehydratase FabZ n=1 Tax=unclassified Candidatus Frackibacter TaxID=2648818 RepID=UPI0008913C61|nr:MULTISPECIES: 3-hydroxyacyl-ACP dehydratase FabZ [unclassified Candidatus Frackibacter]SDC09591.1 3-hydroxyacyl-[acyl-carrier-protein] dehydratase [Candidatus Frackibacter sp. WG11]SEM37708.1 3-hydroxyacyl-[acyl-carrier-protein] dehydratase [Candidatus Frackibacter sp. WG12]SFL43163.1 3-hydroxyacyl-[acyl-carrier-protein] dehydratase [Candidatus Frackibacter sp. WG13]
MLDIKQIKEVLPHRYPFLLVDRILEFKPKEKVVGLKNVTVNEEFFNGHYPEHPVMPGVLIVEAMAQVGGFVMMDSDEVKDKVPYFAGIDKARFRKPVVPGDQLIIEAEVLKLRGKIGKIATKALVDGEVVAEAKLMFAVQDK